MAHCGRVHTSALTKLIIGQSRAAHVARYGSLKLLLLCHSLPLTMRFNGVSFTVRPKLSSLRVFMNFALCQAQRWSAGWHLFASVMISTAFAHSS